jgi:hypothetical protein
VSTTLDARLHATAVKAALEAQLGAVNVYEYGTVPGSDGNAGTLPENYVLITVERRFGGVTRMTAQRGVVGWRITARSVGMSVTNTRLTMLKVATALNEKRLTIDSDPTTPIQFEAEQAPELDSGRFSALSIYTFTH